MSVYEAIMNTGRPSAAICAYSLAPKTGWVGKLGSQRFKRWRSRICCIGLASAFIHVLVSIVCQYP